MNVLHKHVFLNTKKCILFHTIPLEKKRTLNKSKLTTQDTILNVAKCRAKNLNKSAIKNVNS